MGFPRQEYWSGLPFPSAGDLPDPRIKTTSPTSPALAGRFFTTSTTWEAQIKFFYDYTVEVMNRFNGLDLVDRVPEELWIEVHNIVQEAVTKTISKKKKSKKANGLSEEALQIVEERREAKSKGERERYTQPNAEFQRIARRYKKAFL